MYHSRQRLSCICIRSVIWEMDIYTHVLYALDDRTSLLLSGHLSLCHTPGSAVTCSSSWIGNRAVGQHTVVMKASVSIESRVLFSVCSSVCERISHMNDCLSTLPCVTEGPDELHLNSSFGGPTPRVASDEPLHFLLF